MIVLTTFSVEAWDSSDDREISLLSSFESSVIRFCVYNKRMQVSEWQEPSRTVTAKQVYTNTVKLTQESQSKSCYVTETIRGLLVLRRSK